MATPSRPLGEEGGVRGDPGRFLSLPGLVHFRTTWSPPSVGILGLPRVVSPWVAYAGFLEISAASMTFPVLVPCCKWKIPVFWRPDLSARLLVLLFWEAPSVVWAALELFSLVFTSLHMRPSWEGLGALGLSWVVLPGEGLQRVIWEELGGKHHLLEAGDCTA